MSDSEESSSSASSQEEITDDIPMFSEFPSEENQELEETAASQENTLNITKPSQLNQSPLTFACHLKSDKYLKFAVEFLSNPELTSQGLGRIDVDRNGFNITVEKATYSNVVGPLRFIYCVVGHLRLNPARFGCISPLSGNRFSFAAFSQELANVEDEATVYLVNRKETDQLTILALIEGDQNSRKFFVDMSSSVARIRKFRDMSVFFTATVPSDDFRLMVDYLLQQQGPQLVSVEIKNSTAILMIGIDYSWTATYPMLRADGSRAMEMVAGESYSTNFHWTDAGIVESLRRASELDAKLVVLLHAERPKFIILRFNLEDVGYLEFTRDFPVPVSSTPSK